MWLEMSEVPAGLLARRAGRTNESELRRERKSEGNPGVFGKCKEVGRRREEERQWLKNKNLAEYN